MGFLKYRRIFVIIRAFDEGEIEHNLAYDIAECHTLLIPALWMGCHRMSGISPPPVRGTLPDT